MKLYVASTGTKAKKTTKINKIIKKNVTVLKVSGSYQTTTEFYVLILASILQLVNANYIFGL